MESMALNVNTSIVDYLKSVGQDSSYANRSNLYAGAGLNMGAYQGTAQQNVALLNYVRNQGQGQAQTAAPATPKPAPAPASAPPPPQVTASAAPRTDYTASLAKQQQEQYARLQASSAAARQQLMDYYSGLESTTDRTNRLRTELKIGDQENLVNALTTQSLDLNKLIEGVGDSVNARSGDFLMTDADRIALTARERQPLQKELNTLLQQKEREEVGLNTKYANLNQLLQAAFQDEEKYAKPLVLNVDYTAEDQKVAMNLLDSIINRQTQAAFADISSSEDLQRQQEAFRQQLQLEDVRNTNDVAKMKLDASLSSKNGYNANASGALGSNSDYVWDSIVSNAGTEYDVWKYIMDNQDKLRQQGVNVDELWARHMALKAKVGQGGSIRSSGSDDPYARFGL